VFEQLKTFDQINSSIRGLGFGTQTKEDGDKASAQWQQDTEEPLKLFIINFKKSVANMFSVKASLEKESENKIKAAAKAKAKAKAALAKEKPGTLFVAIPAPASSQSEGYGVFNVDLATVPSLLLLSDGAGVDWEAPVISRDCDTIVEMANQAPCKLNLMIFKSGFLKQEMGNPRMRKHMALTGATSVRDKLLSFGPPEDELLKVVEPAFSEVHIWGCGRFMEFCGTDFYAGMSFVRAVTEGSLHLIYVPFNDIAQYISKHCDVQGSVSVAKVRGFMKDLSDQEMQSMLQEKVRLVQTFVSAPAVVYVPAGFIVCEKSINGPAVGLHINVAHPAIKAISPNKCTALESAALRL
jgi:hypothetical protein